MECVFLYCDKSVIVEEVYVYFRYNLLSFDHFLVMSIKESISND